VTNRFPFLLRGLILTIFCGVSLTTQADSPMTAPSNQIIWSRNHRYYALSDVKNDQVTGYQGSVQGRGKKLWMQKGWVRNAFLTHDGQHFIVGYPGQNLLSLQHAPNETMLWFYKSGKLIRRVTLDQLIHDRKNLQPTVSHYYWGHIEGLDKNEALIVTTVEKRTFRFDREGRLKRS
jgi:hypothetical protein